MPQDFLCQLSLSFVFSRVHDVPLFFFHANNTPIRAYILLIKPLQQEFFGMFLFPPKKTMYDLKFSQGFLGNQSFSTKA